MSTTAARTATLATASMLAVLLGGCGPHSFRQATCFDATDDCNWSVVVVRNDTPHAVALRLCMHHCRPGDHRLDPVTVPIGASSPKNQYGGIDANTGGLSWWAVEDPARRTLGCLVLDGHPDKRDGDVVLISQARPCRDSEPATKPIGRTSVQGA
jgi:hypothetical protein